MPRPEGGGSRCGGGGGGPQGGGWVHKEGAGDYWELWDRWVTTGRKWLEIYRLWVYKFNKLAKLRRHACWVSFGSEKNLDRVTANLHFPHLHRTQIYI